MIQKGVVTARITVPTVDKYPLEWLATYLKQLVGSPALKMWQQRLSELETIRHTASQDAGIARSRTLTGIAKAAEEWTIDLSRTSGTMYVGRYPTYEDAHREVNLCLSANTVDRLNEELLPLMSAYTWLVDQVAADLDAAYTAIATAQTDTGNMSLLGFLQAVAQSEDVIAPVVSRLRTLLDEHWANAADYCAATASLEISFTPAGLNRFFNALPAPQTIIRALPWRYVHSPDVMLMAKDRGSVQSGNFQVVIGETHPGTYTVGQHVAAPFRSGSDAIQNDLATFLASPTIMMCDPPESYQRSNINLPDNGALYEIILPGQSSRLSAERIIDAADCTVEVAASCLELVVPSKGLRVPLLMAMAGHLHKALFALASDLAGKSRPERLRMGRTVLKRQSWKITTGNLPEVRKPAEDHANFTRILRWAEQTGLPRFVFAIFPREPKPIYVDFQNPLAVDSFVKLAAGGTDFTLSEMMPNRDALLFGDDRGKFTAEFRMSYLARQVKHD